jgi:hypothetical protein
MNRTLQAFQALFPRSEILKERVLGIGKSIIAVAS